MTLRELLRKMPDDAIVSIDNMHNIGAVRYATVGEFIYWLWHDRIDYEVQSIFPHEGSINITVSERG